jgi:hypothetical protein
MATFEKTNCTASARLLRSPPAEYPTFVLHGHAGRPGLPEAG